ncbi:MAG: hydrogenase maturation peptidase HycI [Dehalococcoidia bacterium]|nr:MAG: hydrogenase maturation peptidase HycI [Dehalococcoidia bacterium]
MKEVILGIGNILNGDDGIGVYVAERVDECLHDAEEEPEHAQAMGMSGVIAIDCGTAPENYTSIIRRHNPDRLVLVDAADMGLTPGSYRIIPPEKIGVMHVSTHNIPLSVFISYVSELCNDVVLIGIQPAGMDFGTALSSIVQKVGDHVASLITESRLNEIRLLEMSIYDRNSKTKSL